MGKLLDLLKTVAFIFILLIGALAILSSSNGTFTSKMPIKPFIVLTGSMRPTIYEGSVVFVQRRYDGFNTGDIITFIRPNNPKENVTHRIFSISSLNGKPTYKTKGDANTAIDPWLVRPDAIWGKVTFFIPLIGYVISFSKTRLGVLLVIALPMLIIIADEFRVIYLEVDAMKKRRREKRTQTVLSAFIMIFISSSLMNLSISPTYAVFTSKVQVKNIQISIGNWGRKACKDSDKDHKKDQNECSCDDKHDDKKFHAKDQEDCEKEKKQQHGSESDNHNTEDKHTEIKDDHEQNIVKNDHLVSPTPTVTLTLLPPTISTDSASASPSAKTIDR